MAQYQYTIGGRTYQTFEALSNFRTAAILTRATRIYKVKYVDVDGEGKDEGKAYAIKDSDVWTRNDAKTEREIQDDILGKINKANTLEGLSEEEEKHRKHMEIKDCEEVQTAESQARNYTSKVFLHGQLEEFPLTARPLSPDLQLQHDLTARSINVTLSKHTSEESYRPTGARKITGRSSKHSCQDHETSVPIRSSFCRYEMKKQVRVVFGNIGVPLTKLMLEDQFTFFMASADAAKGLWYLYSAGYLHRDISDGNILFCDGIGKISDLEYATEFHSDVDGSEHADKSGTPAYISTEVSVGDNLFLPTTLTGEVRDVWESDDSDWGVDGDEDKVSEPPGTAAPDLPFIQHYLNDVESLWWVATFSQTSTVPTDEYNNRFMKHVKQDATSNTPSPFNEQITFHAALFNKQAVRYPFFTKTNVFETRVRLMPQTTQKSTFKALKGAREDLINSYMAFEKDFSVGPKTHLIYEHMARWMRRAAKVSPKHVTPIKQLHLSTKRKNADTKPVEDFTRSKKQKKN